MNTIYGTDMILLEVIVVLGIVAWGVTFPFFASSLGWIINAVKSINEPHETVIGTMTHVVQKSQSVTHRGENYAVKSYYPVFEFYYGGVSCTAQSKYPVESRLDNTESRGLKPTQYRPTKWQNYKPSYESMENAAKKSILQQLQSDDEQTFCCREKIS